MVYLIKKWSDETAHSSKIENLTFPGDRRWSTCTIKVTGTKWRQILDIVVDIGGKITNWHCEPDGGRTSTKEFQVDNDCYINITGTLKIMGIFPPAGAIIEVTCGYKEGTVLKETAVEWQDETGGISCIDKLFLGAEKIWEKCEIKVEGKKGKITGIMTSLIADGEIQLHPSWFVAYGTESKNYSCNIGKKVVLLVPGYITNTVAVTGGGAKITLKGYYRE